MYIASRYKFTVYLQPKSRVYLHRGHKSLLLEQVVNTSRLSQIEGLASMSKPVLIRMHDQITVIKIPLIPLSGFLFFSLSVSQSLFLYHYLVPPNH